MKYLQSCLNALCMTLFHFFLIHEEANSQEWIFLQQMCQSYMCVCMYVCMCKGVYKSSKRVLVKRILLTLDVKFFRHLQSTPLLHEYSGPSISAMLGSIPGSPFLELCQEPTAIPLESLQWCRTFDPSSEASAWGRGKSHRGPDRVSMGDGGSLSCCSWPKTTKFWRTCEPGHCHGG